MNNILNLENISSKFNYEIGLFLDYISTNSLNIENNHNKLKELFFEDIKENPEEKRLFEVVYEDDFKKHDLIFQSLLYSGLLTSVFSFFEHYLSIICNEYIEFTSAKLKLKDINGSNNIDRANKYIKLVLGIQINKLDKYWNPISEFWKIRNCIVHRNSNFIKDEAKTIKEQNLFQTLKKFKTIEIDEKNGNFYLTGNEDIISLIKNIKEYFMSLCDLINRKKFERRYYNEYEDYYFDNLPF